MSSRLRGGDSVTGNQQEISGSRHRKHRSDIDNSFSPSSSSSKSRSLGVRDTSTLSSGEATSKQYSSLPREKPSGKQYNSIPREDTTTKRYSTLPQKDTNSYKYGHEVQSGIDDGSGYKSRDSVVDNHSSRRRSSRQHEGETIDSTNDSSRRRSSRQYEEDTKYQIIDSSIKHSSRQRGSSNFIDQTNDSSRRRSSRHYEGDVTENVRDSSSQRRSSGHNKDKTSERVRDASSQRRSERQYEGETAERISDASQRRSSREHNSDITNQTSDSSRRRSSREHLSDATDQTNDSSRGRSSREHLSNITDQTNNSSRRHPSREHVSNIIDLTNDSSRRGSSKEHKSNVTDQTEDLSRRRSSREHEGSFADETNSSSRRSSSRHYEGEITERNSDSSHKRSSREHRSNTTNQANDSSRRRSSRQYDDNSNDRAKDVSRKSSIGQQEGDVTGQINEPARRQSSKHYQTDLNGHSKDMHRVLSSRKYENGINIEQNTSNRSRNQCVDHTTASNPPSYTQQGTLERGNPHMYDERLDSNNVGVTSQGRIETSLERCPLVSDLNPHDQVPRSKSHRNLDGHESNITTRNTDLRDQGPFEGEYTDRKSRSKGRKTNGENYHNPQDRHRSSSQVREQEMFSSGYTSSRPSSKDNNKVVNGNNRTSDTEKHSREQITSRSDYKTESTGRKTSRTDNQPSGNYKEQTTSKTLQQPVERLKNSNHREISEVRDKLLNNNNEEHMRKRSNSNTGSVSARHISHSDKVHNKTGASYRSSSKQSLKKEDLDISYKTVETRNLHENYVSKPSQRCNNGSGSATQNTQRRSSVMSQQDEDINEIVRQISTSASETSKEALRQGSNGEFKHQRRQHSGDRQSLESLGRVENETHSCQLSLFGHSSRYGTREIADRAGEYSHGSHCPVTESTSHSRGSSTSRRIPSTPNHELDETNMSSYKQDSSLSRRSSSSRSNHDTGFASSPSSPRRDDSHPRFYSDVSPSLYAEEENQRSRADESRRRRRSKMTTNNSLDVPVASLRKEQSLSSSGRGDSSFEEPYSEAPPVVKGNIKSIEECNKETKRGGLGSVESVTPTSSRGFHYERGENARNDTKLSQIGSKDNLAVSKNIGRSSTSIARESAESPKHLSKVDLTEVSSSTSTIRDVNVTSKTSISDSISSLLGRNNKYQQFRSNQPEGTATPLSISDQWRKLKQSILPDKEALSDTVKERTSAATIFYAAAVKFMSSLPGVQNPLSRNMESSSVQSSNGTTISNIPENEKVSTSEDHGSSRAKSETRVTSHDNSTTTIKADKVSSSHSITSMEVPNGITSHRQSTISTTGTLYSLNKTTSAYAVMTEKRQAPGSDAGSQMTNTAPDVEMKRRSKDVDNELTSFLPTEMSRREEKFHDAARSNDAAAIRSLLKERVNINCANSLDRTALHWAAANGNLEAAETLLENGADLEAKDKYGMRAVLWAAWFGHVSVLKVLINTGANTRVTNKQGLGMLHCASENNHVAVISFIFDALEQYDVNQRDKNDRTPLHSAVEGGHVEAVNRLLDAKADLHKKDKCGMTAVHLAAKYGHIEVLKALLLQGVEVDDRDVDGKTALHLAAEAGYKEAVDLLLDYTANPNSETVKEVTPLHLAAQEGHVDICRSLVKYGSNVNAQNFQGNVALHIAANGNHKEVARILIDAKCELDHANTRMQTPLHVAVESGHLDVVQILLAGGASLDTREKSGKSALQLAARGNYVAVVDMLIKAERYYANAREYHDKDVGYVDPDTYLRNPQHPHAAQMKDVLWKLAMKQLKSTDWKRLAYHWHFTPEHVKAIEQEYTGTTSFKEHSYRLLNIWLHGVRKDENVIKLLFEALVAIERRQVAETVRRKVNIQAEKPCSPALCSVS